MITITPIVPPCTNGKPEEKQPIYQGDAHVITEPKFTLRRISNYDVLTDLRKFPKTMLETNKHDLVIKPHEMARTYSFGELYDFCRNINGNGLTAEEWDAFIEKFLDLIHSGRDLTVFFAEPEQFIRDLIIVEEDDLRRRLAYIVNLTDSNTDDELHTKIIDEVLRLHKQYPFRDTTVILEEYCYQYGLSVDDEDSVEE